MRIITIILIFAAEMTFCQGIIKRNPRGYFSLSATGFIKTSTQISSSENSDLKENFSPGADLTLSYSRITRKGLTITSGLGATMLPISYMFTIQPADYNLAPEFDQPLVNKTFEVGNIFFHVPLTLGYTLKKRKLIEPSLQIGVDVFKLNAFSISNKYTAVEESGTQAPIFELKVRSPNSGHSKLWLAYKFIGKVTRVIDERSTFSAGIVANVSTITIYQGRYNFYRQDGTRSGPYTDKGSYVGLQIGYAF